MRIGFLSSPYKMNERRAGQGRDRPGTGTGTRDPERDPDPERAERSRIEPQCVSVLY